MCNLTRSEFYWGMLAGMIVGGAAGLLLAPKPGPEARAWITDKTQDIGGKVRGSTEQVVVKGKELVEKGKDAVIRGEEAIKHVVARERPDFQTTPPAEIAETETM